MFPNSYTKFSADKKLRRANNHIHYKERKEKGRKIEKREKTERNKRHHQEGPVWAWVSEKTALSIPVYICSRSVACWSLGRWGLSGWLTWGRVGPSPACRDQPQPEPVPHSYSQFSQAGSLSVLISSDLLLADNTGNKGQHERWHVCGFFPLIFHPKEKDREGEKVSSLSQTSIVWERKEIKAGRTVTVVGNISFLPGCVLAYLQGPFEFTVDSAGQGKLLYETWNEKHK